MNEPAGHPYFRLTYRSRDLIPAPDRKEALGELFSQARSRNKQQGVSGALLISGDTFVQTIEGDRDAVQSLYERIKDDIRHDSVELLAAEPVDELVFSRWSMARVADDLDEPDTFLLAHKDGIAPAASLRPNTQQEAFLDAMRAAARGEGKFAVTPAAPDRPVGRGGALAM